jgi:hypothetical protein
MYRRRGESAENEQRKYSFSVAQKILYRGGSAENERKQTHFHRLKYMDLVDIPVYFFIFFAIESINARNTSFSKMCERDDGDHKLPTTHS